MNLKKHKPFDFIKLCLFHGSIFIFLSYFAMSTIVLKNFISCRDIFYSYNRKSLIFILYAYYSLSSNNDICI
jgi:hypothetical protein